MPGFCMTGNNLSHPKSIPSHACVLDYYVLVKHVYVTSPIAALLHNYQQ